jgi:hypothetical protein
VAVSLRDLHCQPQVALDEAGFGGSSDLDLADELVRRPCVIGGACVAQQSTRTVPRFDGFGELDLFVRREQRIAADVAQIPPQRIRA